MLTSFAFAFSIGLGLTVGVMAALVGIALISVAVEKLL